MILRTIGRSKAVATGRRTFDVYTMRTMVRADRGRLRIPGVIRGQTYLVQTLPDGGWLVTPDSPGRCPKSATADGRNV